MALQYDSAGTLAPTGGGGGGGLFGNFIKSFDPISFGLKLGGGLLSGYANNQAQNLQIKQMNQQSMMDWKNQNMMADFNYQSALKQQSHGYMSSLQSYTDTIANIANQNKFAVEVRDKQTEIAEKYQLPAIRQSANLAYNAALMNEAQAVQGDRFLREQMYTELMEAQGSNAAAIDPNNASALREAAMKTAGKAGKQGSQLAQTGYSRRAQLQASLFTIANQQFQAETAVLAPLQMPVYQQKYPTAPIAPPAIEKPPMLPPPKKIKGKSAGAGMVGGILQSLFA